MMKVLRCSDLMPGCSFEARADSEAELIRIAKDHALESHAVRLTAEMVETVRGAIRLEEDPALA